MLARAMAKLLTRTLRMGRSLAAKVSEPIRNSPSGIITISGAMLASSFGKGIVSAVFLRGSRDEEKCVDAAHDKRRRHLRNVRNTVRALRRYLQNASRSGVLGLLAGLFNHSQVGLQRLPPFREFFFGLLVCDCGDDDAIIAVFPVHGSRHAVF